MEVDLMAEACKELGADAMQWAEQAEWESCQSLNPPHGYDALGYNQVYSTQEYSSNPGSFLDTHYYNATPSYSSTSGHNALQDFDPVLTGSNYSATQCYSEAQGSLGYEHVPNVEHFSSLDVGQAMYAPPGQNHYQQPQTLAAHYQYHPTSSLPRHKRGNVLENTVDKQLQYDGGRADQQQRGGVQAVVTDHQGREIKVELGKEQDSLDPSLSLSLASMIGQQKDMTNVRKRPLVSSLHARVPERKVTALDPAPKKEPMQVDAKRSLQPISGLVGETHALLDRVTSAFQLTPLKEQGLTDACTVGQDTSHLVENLASISDSFARASHSGTSTKSPEKEDASSEVYSAPISASVRDIVASKEEQGLMISGLEEVSFALYVADCWASLHGAASVTSPTSPDELRSWLYQAKHWWTQVAFRNLTIDEKPPKVPLDYRKIYWAREVAFNRMHPVPAQRYPERLLKLGYQEDERNPKEEEVRRSPVKLDDTPESVSETSPNASSSGLQTKMAKRKRTGVKTAYSFYCDQVGPEVCQLYGVEKNTKETRNVVRAKWNALPAYEKAHFKQLSREDAERVKKLEKLEKALDDKENKAPSMKRSKMEGMEMPEMEMGVKEMQDQKLQNKNNDAASTKRLKMDDNEVESKKMQDKENEAPSTTRSNTEASMEVLSTALEKAKHQRGEVFLGINEQGKVHVDSIASAIVGEMDTDAQRARVIVEASDVPETPTVGLEPTNVNIENFPTVSGISESRGNSVKTLAITDILNKVEDVHDDRKEVDDDEENSEEELERSLAAEMHEVTLEIENSSQLNGFDQATDQEAAVRQSGNMETDTFEGVGLCQSYVSAQDIAAGVDAEKLVRVVGADDELEEGQDDWQWEEVDGEENEELGTEFVKSFESSENVQDVEEVGCTVVGRADLKNREDDPVLPLKHRTGVKAAILESKARGACVGEYRTKISFVEDIVAMDSLWDWEGKESRNENLKEEVGQEMVKEEEIGSEEELKDVVTISIENCTVLNLDVVLDAPEIFNIPGNLKEQVPDEFSTPPSETKPAKKRGRSSKGSKGKRSKQ